MKPASPYFRVHLFPLRLLIVFAYIAICALAAPVIAQDQEPATGESGSEAAFAFDFPVLDLPYQNDAARAKAGGDATFLSYLEGFESPSMEQSLALSADFYSGVYWGLKALFAFNKPAEERDWKFYLRWSGYCASLMGATYLGMYFPFGDSWLHEEFHRAMMSSNGTDSFDMVLTFPIGSTTISVNHIDDADLVRFKASNPAGFIRMHVSGIEGEYLLVERLERGNFFDNRDLTIMPVVIYSTLNSASYVMMCSGSSVDGMTEQMNLAEADIAARDFTGFDFLGWAYDLFRPSEPYGARGLHPSGAGIDRYIKTTDLGTEELSYLRLQGCLSFLNFLSPMLFVNKSIPLKPIIGREAYGNFAVRHFLTSSGSDSVLQIYLKDSEWKTAWALHNYVNRQSWFPAIEAELVEKKVDIGRISMLVSPRLILGMQPRLQEFRATVPEFFCYGRVEAELLTGCWATPVASLEFKTAGWVAGNEYINANVSFNAGMRARF